MTVLITPYRTCCNCHHFKYKILANTICKSCCRISIAIARLVIKIATNIVTSMNRNQQQHLNNSRHRHQQNKDLQRHNNSRDYYHQGAAITTMSIKYITNIMPRSTEHKQQSLSIRLQRNIGLIEITAPAITAIIISYSYYSQYCNRHSYSHNHHHSYSSCYSCHEGHHVHGAIISRRCSCSSPLT